jgi:O-acetyl-ADP-ribose deacetylase
LSIKFHYGDILDLDVDAVVNPANTELSHAGTLAAAIVAAGGTVIQEESDRIGWCDLGSAVATSGGHLRARHVIHVPTVDYATRRRATLDELRGSIISALEIARSVGARSIAFPMLGTGIAGLPAPEVAKAMAGAMSNVKDLDIRVCVFYQNDLDAVKSAFGMPEVG